jgi:hypothetical protein
MWCVVKSMVLPGLCLVRRSQVDRLAYGSIPEVGSSRMTISEPPIRAMATLKAQNEYINDPSCSFLPGVLADFGCGNHA